MITDTQQPQPGPSPTPTPKPAAALKIISISANLPDGGAVLTLPAPFGELRVSKDFMDTCQPEADGYYVITDTQKFFLSDEDFEGHFPVSP